MSRKIGDFPDAGRLIDSRAGNPQAVVSDITSDSREVAPGWTFFALRGEQTDGNRFLADALRRGATCVVYESPLAGNLQETYPDACFLQTSRIHALMASMSAWLYDTEFSPLVTIGITGTNGKTTVAALINHGLRQAGFKTIFIGTTGQEVAGRYYATDYTTPPSYVIHRLMREGLRAGATHLVMEVSSHAIKLKRVWGLLFDAAVFTNLTHEHQEIHPDMEDYFRTKAVLFDMLKPDGCGLVNADDPYGARLLSERRSTGVLWDFGKHAVHIRLKSSRIQYPTGSQQLELGIGGEDVWIASRLPGEYNAYNVAAAAGVLAALGWHGADLANVWTGFPGVEGRFNRYRVGAFEAVIDFAHTPDGLSKVLDAARAIVPVTSRIIALFGCPGSRDPSKRPLMGAIASEKADWVVVTTDDIHYEEPEAIVANIVDGIDKDNYEVVLDRREAIRAALSKARAGDAVILAGRGHEKYQYVKDQKVPFEDVRVLIEEAEKLGLSVIRQ